MKTLHLFANYRWTGPAEPALNLCLALREAGVEADFACAPGPSGIRNKLVETARANGLEPVLDLALSKHRNPIRNYFDQKKLVGLLRQGRYDLVHCHLDNDHTIAAKPCKDLRIPLIRSSYHGTGFPLKPAHARLLKSTTHLIEPSRIALEEDARTHGISRARMTVVQGAVDVHRFNPERPLPDARATLGISPDAFVAGIVARMQPHRRYDDLWKALKRLKDSQPDVQLIVVGRGTHQEAVGMRPVQDLGIDDIVHFPGFLDGDSYAGTLNAFDVKVFLVPGSDGTCRAVREAMAMGTPVVTARRGMLPELVEHGVTGLVCDEGPHPLYDALHQLATNPGLREELGRNAFEKARREFTLEGQAEQVIEVYRQVLART